MTQFVRRAAAISTGTLVLCLAGAAPALAAGQPPLPGPDTGPIVQTVKPVLDTLEPIVPVRGVVHDVSQQAGLGDPLATPRHKPHHHPQAQQPVPTTPASHQPVVRATSHERHHVVPAGSGSFSWRLPATPLDLLAGGTTIAQRPVPVSAPTVAASPIQRITTAATQAVGGLDPRTPLGRTVLVVLGTMLIGILSGGHLKTAQERLLPRVG